MWNRVEIFRQIGVDNVGIAPADQPVRFLDRIDRAATRAIAVGIVLEIRLENGFQHELGGSLNHPITDRWNAERALASTIRLRIITRRTGSGRYVFETSSSRKPASQASRPAASICPNLIPSTPGAPALPRASP